MTHSGLTKNGIIQLAGPNEAKLVHFRTNETIYLQLRDMSKRTGLSMRSIIEAGAKRQLRELERQLAKRQTPTTDEGTINDE